MFQLGLKGLSDKARVRDACAVDHHVLQHALDIAARFAERDLLHPVHRVGIGIARIADTYQTSVKRGSLTAEAKDKRLGLIEGRTSLDDLASVDMIVEAVFEEMSLKLDIFGKLDGIAKPDAVLASNTSYLDVDKIATATKRPDAVLGTHFFSPANVMRLVEVVRGKKTSPEALPGSLVGKRYARRG